MELDVNLSKADEQSWGFCLIGGVDFKMPLTVVKVLPESPAENAGLQNGDTVARINDTIACHLSHDEARAIVEAAATRLTLGVQRGLYDPVLDEYEPIYEQIDQDGFDQPSQPTEVHDTFQIQQFLDPQSDICDAPKELKSDIYDLSERSLTASPFIPQTKPYRPFSTDPLDVPPLEDPIILNPNYRDEFNKTEQDDVDYEVLCLGSNLNVDLKFKLPISEQYDPEWVKKETEGQPKEKKLILSESENKKSKVDNVSIQEKGENNQGTELKEKLLQDIELMNKMKEEVDLNKIEMTASNIVEDSIVKAVSVAEEISKEMEVELHDFTNINSGIKELKSVKGAMEVSSTITSMASELKTENDKLNSQVKVSDVYDAANTLISDDIKIKRKEINEVIENSNAFTQEKVSLINVESVNEIENAGRIDDNIIDNRNSIKQQVTKVIEEGSVRSKSMIFEQQEITSDNKTEVQNIIPSKDVTAKVASLLGNINSIENSNNNIQQKNIKQVESKKFTEGKSNEARATFKSQAEQKSYMIGLQTIPNIRGTLSSSCHYNLLLKTFFIHLTDVMVALSRFIISEPVFSKSEETHEIKQDKISTKETSESLKMSYESKADDEIITKKEEKKVTGSFAEHNINKEVENKVIKQIKGKETEDIKAYNVKSEEKTNRDMKNEMKFEDKVIQKKEVDRAIVKVIEQENKVIKLDSGINCDEDLTVVEKTPKRALSGLEMAQLCEKKSEELTGKMECVILEFENKAGIEETLEVKERRRRSRSRSQVQEEVIRENDSLHWQSKVESVTSQEKTNLNMLKNEFSNKVESAARHKIEREDTSEIITTKPAGKQMYVAIVESHIFTNKDAIFEENTTDISKSTTAVESAKTVNIAMESNDAVSTENVSIKCSNIKNQEKMAKGTVEKLHVSSIHETANKQIEEVNKELTEVTEEIYFEKATEVNTKSTQESVIPQIVVPIIEVQEVVKEDITEDVNKISVKEESYEVAKNESIKLQENVSESDEHNCIKIGEAYIELTSVNEEKHSENETVVDMKSTQEVIAQQTIESVIEAQDIRKVSVKEESFEVIKEENIKTEQAINENLEDKYDTVTISEANAELICVNEHETKFVKEEQIVDLDVSAKIKIEKPIVIDTEPKIESAALKIVKEQVIEVQPSPEILESEETKVLKIDDIVDLSKGIIAESKSKFIDISESNSLNSFADIQNKAIAQESTFTAKSMTQESSFALQSVIQESSFTAKSTSAKSDIKSLTLRTDLAQENSLERQSSTQSDENNNIDTPTPTTVPPTPVTDEYVFKLLIPLPKNRGTTPIPRDPSPEIDEDPHIVKKKLVPYIETTLESPIIYDPPLPTPPVEKVQSPVYTKPGLKGGAERKSIKEEILEIGRKSSLLASAIDETIKSIEEYKEQVGMETNKEIQESKMEYSSFKTAQSFSKEESSTAFKQTYISNSKDESVWSVVDKQIENNNRDITELAQTAIENEKVVDEEEINTSQIAEEVSESALEICKTKDRDMTESKKISMDIEEVTEMYADLDSNIKLNYKTETVEETVKEVVEGLKINEKAKENISESSQVDNVTSEMNEISKICETTAENIENSVAELEQTVIKVPEKEVETNIKEITDVKVDPLLGYRPVKFNPEFAKYPRPQSVEINIQAEESGRAYMTPAGELIGTVQGIVDSLEEATVDEDIAKELGKPGMTEDKIAALISGESEMLREAHVMGLTRVLTSHMTRPTDDSSVDFKKIKPILESLKDSAVLKALNDDLTKTKEEKKKEERKWTTFLQKPKRPVPKVKFGYYAYVDQEEELVETPYKVKIVKQPKPKVAPDYKPENFDTGPLPWEERALNEPPPSPIEAEEPILVPEELPEFLEAVDPLPESEVPDLEETGIPLPPPKPVEETTVESPVPLPVDVVEEPAEEIEEVEEPVIEQETTQSVDMENRIAEQLMNSVQNMVDPNATLDQQLSQMRAQLAALAQLPEVIQQTLQMVTKQLTQLQQESITVEASRESSHQVSSVQETQYLEMNGQQEITVANDIEPIVEESEDVEKKGINVTNNVIIEEQAETENLSQEEMEKLKKEEAEMLEEQNRIEKQKKDMMDQMRQEQESRQLKQRPTPRVGKPKPVFGPPNPEDRPLVLTGGRKWRGPKDVYDEQMLSETLKSQAELIQGKTLGASFESVHLPFDERINFMKYEKPPVSLDHLQNSEVYKMIHNMEQVPVKRVEMLTPVIAEADYREKCRSISPCIGRMVKEQHTDIPQQVQP